ncbi:hypothetical protein ACFSTH_15640 [Paenibacillus yanchengensis]|uniref:Uncharacterized protein n=1 Tax=Paenibacillus yanchengensis TaxID=2035833 RepID=A0ABW4YFU5_9BACL
MNSSKKRRHSQKVAASALLLAVMLTVSACGDSNKPKENPNQIEQPAGNDQLPEGSGMIDSGVANNNESSTDQPVDGANNGSQPGSQTNEQTAPGDTPTDNGSATSESPDPVSQPIQATGEYVGQIDSNSVEINVNNEPLSMQLTDETRAIIEELDSDVPVQLEYTEQALNDGSNSIVRTLLSIKKAN